MLSGLDLFSGIGGISLALREWVRPIAYCEVDRYCQGVLLSRMQSGDLSEAPVWDDVRTLKKVLLPEVDIITGGFPCQDISCAGAGVGLEGERSRLFFELVRLVGDLRPRFVFLENVPAITVRGLERVLLEFTSLGYDARWTIVSAAEFGACHLRERWFLLAHTDSERGWDEQIEKSECNDTSTACDNSPIPSNPWPSELEGIGRQESQLPRPVSYGRWTTEPTIRGRAHGISNRVDRVRGLGNAVVPVQAREAFMRLMGLTEKSE